MPLLILALLLSACSSSTGPDNTTQKSLCSDTPGTICTWAGTGDAGFNGDGHTLLASTLYWPVDLAFTDLNTPYILDWNNHRVRRVTSASACPVCDRAEGAPRRSVPPPRPPGPSRASHSTKLSSDGWSAISVSSSFAEDTDDDERSFAQREQRAHSIEGRRVEHRSVQLGSTLFPQSFCQFLPQGIHKALRLTYK